MSLRNVIRQQIQSEQDLLVNSTTAVVKEYDKRSSRASISFQNPSGEGYLYRENVPVLLSLRGQSSLGLQKGQKVYITFNYGSILSPVIVGVIDAENATQWYEEASGLDAGSLYVDDSIAELPEVPYEPLCSRWIDKENQDEMKYDSPMISCTKTDSVTEYAKRMESILHYGEKENGTCNPFAKSIIKQKDNGDIDIFVDGNVGVRINKASKRIEIFSDNVIVHGTIERR